MVFFISELHFEKKKMVYLDYLKNISADVFITEYRCYLIDF